jgi:molybdopterin molybdotransferase
MLRFEEALSRVLALGTPPLDTEAVDLDEASGRVLGEDVRSTADLPPFDYSAMDGYAVRAHDLELASPSPPYRLPVRGESRTGVVPGPLEPASAMRIFTGAAMPDGADTVIMQEHVTRDDAFAVVSAKPRRGQHVRRRGEDLACGSLAIPRGTRLRPAHLAFAASLDRAALTVTKRPVVAILATGDELRRPGTDPVPGTIPESNTAALRAMARSAGAETRALPFVPDDRSATERAFAAALDASDVVVTVGGVSVGDHDLVRPALEAVGVTLELWKVAIKPGKPIAIGRFPRPGRREALVVGLPGNPASAIVTFAVFGVPLLRALQGDLAPVPGLLRAKMTRAHAHDPGRLELARAQVTRSASGLAVATLGNQASGALTSMAHADALALIPAEASGVAAGDEVDVWLLSELGG